jgi:hypothetical protein
VETLFTAALAISIGNAVLSEFSKPSNSGFENLSNAMTLDNAWDLIS